MLPRWILGLGEQTAGRREVFGGKIDSLAASSRKALPRRSDQGHDLIPTDLPIADMGRDRRVGELHWAGGRGVPLGALRFLAELV